MLFFFYLVFFCECNNLLLLAQRVCSTSLYNTLSLINGLLAVKENLYTRQEKCMIHSIYAC